MPSEKTLKRIVIILGVLLVGGFLTLVSIMIYRAVNLVSEDGDVETTISETGGPVLTIPGDATPVGMSKETSVTIIKVRNAEGEIEELVFDATTGDYLGKLARGE